MMRNKEMNVTTGEYILQKTKEHKVARFYCNWKCHKYEPTQTEFAHAAVRGIVSCSGTADEAVCDYLDFLLNPGMQKLRSYLKELRIFFSGLKYPCSCTQNYLFCLVFYNHSFQGYVRQHARWFGHAVSKGKLGLQTE